MFHFYVSKDNYDLLPEKLFDTLLKKVSEYPVRGLMSSDSDSYIEFRFESLSVAKEFADEVASLVACENIGGSEVEPCTEFIQI